MKYKIFINIMFFSIFFVVLQPPVYSQYLLKSSVIGSGGGIFSNSSYQVNFTIGQSITGTSSNSNNLLSSGFWYSTGIITDVEDEEIGLPDAFQLFQNYPNPFNPSTNIKYAIPEPSHINIAVYNVLGQSVDVLLDEDKPAGYYTLTYNASKLASGVYIYRIVTKNFVESKKFMLLK